MRALFTVCLALLCSAALPLAAQSAQEVFQQGLALERAQGKLDSAIALYRRVVATAGQNRALAARALIRLGSAYEVQGKSAARASYERVVRDFGDQSELAAQARERIAALDGSGTLDASGSAGPVIRRISGGQNADALSSAPFPDGRSFAYTDWSTGNLAVHDLAGGKDRQLTHLPPRGSASTNRYVETSVVSADGKRIAYAEWTGKDYEIRVVPSAGGASHLVRKLDVATIYSWSPAGDQLLGIVSAGDQVTLSWIDPQDGSSKPIHELKSWPVNVTLSPDGRWIAFDELSREQPLASYELRIVAADGSGYHALLRNSAGDWHPLWTPDGRGVAFLSDRAASRGEWFVEVANGEARGQPILLKGDMGDNIPMGFSKNGTFFYETRAARDVQVATIDPQTGHVLEGPAFASRTFLGNHTNPEWSPDGRSLATILMLGAGTGMPFSRVIEILDMETGTRRQLAPELSQIFLPKWSPDGKSLLIWAIPVEKTSTAGFYTVDVATGRLQQVYLGPNLHGIGSAAWSADGRSIYYPVADSISDQLWRFDLRDSSQHLAYADKRVKRVMGVGQSPDSGWVSMTVTVRSETDTTLTKKTRLLSTSDGSVRDLPEFTTPTGPASPVQWMPDGAFIGIVPRKADNLYELWRLPLDGTPPRKLEIELPSLTFVRFSRDGRKVAFQAETQQAGLGFWAIDGLLPKSPSAKPR